MAVVEYHNERSSTRPVVLSIPKKKKFNGLNFKIWNWKGLLIGLGPSSRRITWLRDERHVVVAQGGGAHPVVDGRATVGGASFLRRI